MGCERGGSTRCAATRYLVRRPGPIGTETAVKVARIRPWGCQQRPACKLPDGHMRGGEIPGSGPILARFCRDPALSRDNFPNSGSYGPLRGHMHHITNIAIVRRLNRGLLLKISVSTGTAFQILPRGPKAAACAAVPSRSAQPPLDSGSSGRSAKNPRESCRCTEPLPVWLTPPSADPERGGAVQRAGHHRSQAQWTPVAASRCGKGSKSSLGRGTFTARPLPSSPARFSPPMHLTVPSARPMQTCVAPVVIATAPPWSHGFASPGRPGSNRRRGRRPG